MSIVIKNVLLNDRRTDILIEGNKITSVSNNIKTEGIETIIDGSSKAAFPGLVNVHTHAAMTFFRGYGDDLPLEEWLNTKIWPNERNLTDEIVYWGTKLACLEMIKTGTTTFNDMYFRFKESARATDEMGIRGVFPQLMFDGLDPIQAKKVQSRISAKDFEGNYSSRIMFSIAPHAIYTVSGGSYKWAMDFAKDHNIIVHTHLAETQTEYQNSIKNFGMSPIRYLNSLGVLRHNLVIAHCLWLDKDEIKMLADNDVKVVHNPNSNLKLASGHRFLYNEMNDKGICIGLGTDGCSSSNNLDMIEAMKMMSLLQKGWRLDPTALPAEETIKVATENGARALNINTGKIEVGKLADIFLVNINTTAFTPFNNNTASNLVYAANGNNVDTVICDGKVIMKNRKVTGEEEILQKVNELVGKLIKH
ncbi:MAG: amidohydrolase [Bacteroidales bacterium]|nr:amidohydrolase [Bacteroidales bacterium]